jgi:hypothetical protein
MKRFLVFCIAMVLIAGPVLADGDDDGPKAWLSLSGFYAFNGYSQQNFFLGAKGGAGGVSDNDEYSIQMFRLMSEFGYGDNIKAVVRADLAQGIWGIDNDQRTPERGGFSNLFNNKDTNFSVHIDWAYIDFNYPDSGFRAKLGRQHYVLGHKLVVDQDNDGIWLSKKAGPGALVFTWSKMFEGADSLSDNNDGPVGGTDARDSDLFTLTYSVKTDNWNFDPYLAYYKDSGIDDGTAYIPQGFQYFNARFRPQITDAQVLGFAFQGKAGIFTLKGEVDYLTGNDDIQNVDSGRNQVLDVNNGDLEGWNLYLDAKVALGPGKLGAVLGMGSGDDDPMSGKGNINKIRTNGFFYVTEVWEDSVMPDELGITPQGLGSPASRGYREFENTNLFQLNYTWPINEKLTYFVAGTYIRATEDIWAWSGGDDGIVGPADMGPDKSDDLGEELDMKLTWKVSPGLAWIFRGGYFWAGDGAGYLINGNINTLENAYELRTTIKFSFGGLSLGK